MHDWPWPHISVGRNISTNVVHLRNCGDKPWICKMQLTGPTRRRPVSCDQSWSSLRPTGIASVNIHLFILFIWLFMNIWYSAVVIQCLSTWPRSQPAETINARLAMAPCRCWSQYIDRCSSFKKLWSSILNLQESNWYCVCYKQHCITNLTYLIYIYIYIYDFIWRSKYVFSYTKSAQPTMLRSQPPLTGGPAWRIGVEE